MRLSIENLRVVVANNRDIAGTFQSTLLTMIDNILKEVDIVLDKEFQVGFAKALNRGKHDANRSDTHSGEQYEAFDSSEGLT
jgi:hypothetical protein